MSYDGIDSVVGMSGLFIIWEGVAGTLGSAEHILRTAEITECKIKHHEKPIHLQLIKKRKRPNYFDTEISLLCSQEPATCPHPEPD